MIIKYSCLEVKWSRAHWFRPMVSNMQPAGRMWPFKGLSAARDSLLNQQYYKFWSLLEKNDQKRPNFVLIKVYFSILPPAEPFLFKTAARGDIFHPNVALQWFWVWEPLFRLLWKVNCQTSLYEQNFILLFRLSLNVV